MGQEPVKTVLAASFAGTKRAGHPRKSARLFEYLDDQNAHLNRAPVLGLVIGDLIGRSGHGGEAGMTNNVPSITINMAMMPVAAPKLFPKRASITREEVSVPEK